MATLKTPRAMLGRVRKGADGKPLNFLFEQSALMNRKKWTGRQDFWQSIRRNAATEPERWEAFETWRQNVKDQRG